jgi:hypothetical protein
MSFQRAVESVAVNVHGDKSALADMSSLLDWVDSQLENTREPAC